MLSADPFFAEAIASFQQDAVTAKKRYADHPEVARLALLRFFVFCLHMPRSLFLLIAILFNPQFTISSFLLSSLL